MKYYLAATLRFVSHKNCQVSLLQNFIAAGYGVRSRSKSMNGDRRLSFVVAQKPRAFSTSQRIHGAQYLLRLPSLSLPLRQPAPERDSAAAARQTRMADSFITEPAIRSALCSITSSPSNAQSFLECEQVAPDASVSGTLASIGSS